LPTKLVGFGCNVFSTTGFASFGKSPRDKVSLLKFYLEAVVPISPFSRMFVGFFDPLSFLSTILCEKVLHVIATGGSFRVDKTTDHLLENLLNRVVVISAYTQHLLFCRVFKALEGRTNSGSRDVSLWAQMVQTLLKEGDACQIREVFKTVLAVVLLHGPGWTFDHDAVMGSVFGCQDTTESSSGAVAHLLRYYSVLQQLPKSSVKKLVSWLGFDFRKDVEQWQMLKFSEVLGNGSCPTAEAERPDLNSSSSSTVFTIRPGNFETTFHRIALKMSNVIRGGSHEDGRQGIGQQWGRLLGNVPHEELHQLPPGTIKRLWELVPGAFVATLSLRPLVTDRSPQVLGFFLRGKQVWCDKLKNGQIPLTFEGNPPCENLDDRTVLDADEIMAGLFSTELDLRSFLLSVMSHGPRNFGVLPNVLQLLVMDYYLDREDVSSISSIVLFAFASVVHHFHQARQVNESLPQPAETFQEDGTQERPCKKQKL